MRDFLDLYGIKGNLVRGMLCDESFESTYKPTRLATRLPTSKYPVMIPFNMASSSSLPRAGKIFSLSSVLERKRFSLQIDSDQRERRTETCPETFQEWPAPSWHESTALV